MYYFVTEDDVIGPQPLSARHKVYVPMVTCMHVKAYRERNKIKSNLRPSQPLCVCVCAVCVCVCAVCGVRCVCVCVRCVCVCVCGVCVQCVCAVCVCVCSVCVRCVCVCGVCVCGV